MSGRPGARKAAVWKESFLKRTALKGSQLLVPRAEPVPGFERAKRRIEGRGERTGKRRRPLRL
ncbi:hypothetical protein HMPREF1986_02670 [Oribacterium sp. oral taxon 078 str. F0263]|nr:hypothetical protein HMPREF1986_02670 [Oribacterium sp. oral taxon 078 str. F0263]